MKRASFAIALSTLLGTAVGDVADSAAQEPVRLPGRFISHVSVAGAFDARNNGRSDPEMYLGLATLEWSTKVTGLAVRLDGIYAQRDRINRTAPSCGPTCDGVGTSFAYLTSKVTAAGATVGASYDLRSRGALRPYVFASGGLMRTHDKFATGTMRTFTCTLNPCTWALPAPSGTQRNDRPLSAAAQAGAGIVYSWPWVSRCSPKGATWRSTTTTRAA